MKLEVLTQELLFLLATPPTPWREPETSWARTVHIGPDMVVGGLASGALEARGSLGLCPEPTLPASPETGRYFLALSEDLPAFEINGGLDGGALRLGWNHASVEGRQPSP